ncbi:MAG: hypothetical protein PHX64_05625 [Candidatus Omnitrophica bacterium]|nr:hypothetical protein [Candidatus Omnitrophota bacterium]MDD5311212.1 hypothetical protein [Candidatus Omnitrophota bacterium]MDD5546121.1 hypothetical protein [Candidatus Omnitrophota bacterium]
MKKRTTLDRTFANMWGDYTFWLKLNHKKAGITSLLSFLLLPGTCAICIYRIAHWFDGLNIRLISRLMQNIGIMITGTDLNPRAEIGKGFILFHPVATAITGNVGENAVIAGALKAGGDGSSADAGAGPGLPVIGNNVQFGVDILILGPVTIGDGCWILSRATIFKDIPAGSIVAGTPARVMGKVTPGANMYERAK